MRPCLRACLVALAILAMPSCSSDDAPNRAVQRATSDMPADTARPGLHSSPSQKEDTDGPKETVAIIRDYYTAIDAKNYRRAYQYWGEGRPADGQTFDAFRNGFSETTSVEVEIGKPGRIEPAAGSRYIEVPVVIRAELENGTKQRFEGTYTLRRSVAAGATAEQRRWHLYSADVPRAHRRK